MSSQDNQIKSFSETGRFQRAASFLEKHPDAVLKEECTDVVHYVGGHFIQVLNGGVFYVDETFQSKSLDEAEVKLIQKIKNK